MKFVNKIVLALYGLLLQISVVNAQNFERTSQYIINRYAINDSYLGQDSATQLTGALNKQWLDINGSPLQASVYFELPVNEQFATGIKLKNRSNGPLNETLLGVSGSYELRLDRRYDHKIRMGMSIGVGNINFNGNKLDDPSDPVVESISNNKFFMFASLGISYIYNHKWEFGVSLPNISNRQILTEATNSVVINPFDTLILNSNYLFRLNRHFNFIPHFLFYHDASIKNQMEFLGVFEYKKQFNLGAGYRTDFGLTALVGFEINRIININYAYSTGLSDQFKRTNGSHELFFKIRI